MEDNNGSQECWVSFSALVFNSTSCLILYLTLYKTRVQIDKQPTAPATPIVYSIDLNNEEEKTRNRHTNYYC